MTDIWHNVAVVVFLGCNLMIFNEVQAQAPSMGTMAAWEVPFVPEAPGGFSAEGLLHAPAGKFGPVTARDGRFQVGDRRIRFWGVNLCFSGNFPTHEQADALAARLARFGVNAVRFHHMDMFPYPGGIFADESMTALHPEALDRLDYFIAALKKRGVYSNLNLHVSRSWSKARGWPKAAELPSFDKLVDIFHPELIEANKQYARDLLTHVNAYTKTRYADEPAVAMVEINNEDSLFLWSAERELAELPEPYAGMFQKLWNDWLLKKHSSRAALAEAWALNIEPLGENMLKAPDFSDLRPWYMEQHSPARVMANLIRNAARLEVRAIGGEPWHLQFQQAGLKLEKGRFYTLSFTAKSDEPATITASVGQAHEPWRGLGLSTSVKLSPEMRAHRFGFIATGDDDNARVSFAIGQQAGRTITFSSVALQPGGQEGLRDDEDPAAGTVARRRSDGSEAPARSEDWYAFLQETDEAYFVEMKRFLQEEIGVIAPITGTIGLGALGTLSQSKMDFVDAHSYWDHPQFPGRGWDGKNWLIHNKAMSDDPAGSTLWSLAATRVRGLPFTVTEYNHSAPNDWAAETIPMIAAYAAMQDWDGVFLFAYSHNNQYEKERLTGFFDIEGDPVKWNLMPVGARLFLGGSVAPSAVEQVVHPRRAEMLRTAGTYHHQIWPFLRNVHSLTWEDALTKRLAVSFDTEENDSASRGTGDARITWTSDGEETGQFIVRDDRAVVFTGFPRGRAVELGALTIERSKTPFIALTLVPSDPEQTIATADRLLLTAAARVENTAMKWDDARRTVSDQWGTRPLRLEVVEATISLPGRFAAYPLDSRGRRMKTPAAKRLKDEPRTTIELGSTPTMWYELVREE